LPKTVASRRKPIIALSFLLLISARPSLGGSIDTYWGVITDARFQLNFGSEIVDVSQAIGKSISATLVDTSGLPEFAARGCVWITGHDCPANGGIVTSAALSGINNPGFATAYTAFVSRESATTVGITGAYNTQLLYANDFSPFGVPGVSYDNSYLTIDNGTFYLSNSNTNAYEFYSGRVLFSSHREISAADLPEPGPFSLAGVTLTTAGIIVFIRRLKLRQKA
jgi:hypothetical protein